MVKRVLGLCLLVAVVNAASYPNPITDDELVSVVTSSIDPFFYKVGSEVGTDKVQYVYSCRPLWALSPEDLCRRGLSSSHLDNPTALFFQTNLWKSSCASICIPAGGCFSIVWTNDCPQSARLLRTADCTLSSFSRGFNVTVPGTSSVLWLDTLYAKVHRPRRVKLFGATAIDSSKPSTPCEQNWTTIFPSWYYWQDQFGSDELLCDRYGTIDTTSFTADWWHQSEENPSDY